jgi:cell division protease FtsH
LGHAGPDPQVPWCRLDPRPGPGFSSRPYAEATQAAIDGEVSKLLRQAEERAVELLKNHRPELGALVDLLLVRETVDGSDVYLLAGRRAAPPAIPRD